MSGNNPFDDILAPQPQKAANPLGHDPFGDDNEPDLLGGSSRDHSRGGQNASGTSRDDGKSGYALDPFFDEQVYH
jgi:hypothetical protein